MRLLALAALLGNVQVCNQLTAQSLAEHAAAVSGATIGTSAGKPIGTALAGISDGVKKSASQTTAPKAPKSAAVPATSVRGAIVLPSAPDIAPGGRVTSTRGSVRRAVMLGDSKSADPPIAPIFAAPFVKQPSVKDVAGIPIGATDSDLRAALGVPESRVSIPDDGHLIEICQYWANGEQVGVIRLDNGHVVSVQARN